MLTKCVFERTATHTLNVYHHYYIIRRICHEI